jgi:hypothetical protein
MPDDEVLPHTPRQHGQSQDPQREDRPKKDGGSAGKSDIKTRRTHHVIFQF